MECLKINQNRTELNTLGEFGFIEHVSKRIGLKNPESVKGIGDDAAVIHFKNKMTVVPPICSLREFTSISLFIP